VPVPEHAGGGYTHEQHKRNSVVIHNAGVLYRLTGDQSYADVAANLLRAYARMYPSLGEHPQKKEQSPGKLFWQSLNEAVWLVTSIQGYDAIFETLDEAAREEIENSLFHPMIRFLSVEAPQTFDKIHNHGTWAVAAVGMSGYVLDRPDYVEMALFGLKRDGSAGFMKQLDLLFSPDGYYSEGPYYQRYALMPFVLLASAIERNEPERGIFAHRNGILLKAIETTIQLSYAGLFFPINDAIKDKGIDTIELCYGVATAFGISSDPRLLSIAEAQNRVVLTGNGFRLAKAIEEGLAEPFEFRSMQLGDGAGGKQGALGILRNGEGAGHQAVVFKATAQGMGHGHFDKLSWIFYDNGYEIVADYGAARFLNVESKYGGHYLPENKTWAKQTVAHNTLVVDESSHFAGDWKKGDSAYPVPLVFDLDDNIELTAARMEGAYEGVTFTRVLALLKNETFPHPLVLDVLKVASEQAHQYDLPLHFQGQVTKVSHPLQASTQSMTALGEHNGYQHLWLRAKAEIDEGELFQLTWLKANRFYTYGVLSGASMKAIFTETGANDPDFNLRREQALILRVPEATDHSFVALLEPHGEYNGSREFTTASTSSVRELRRISQDGLDVIRIVARDGSVVHLALSYDPDPEKSHRAKFGDATFEWSGFYQLIEGRESND
ncbi:MAG: alginate lyase family protein, partial [Gammaproteobacteria bacterium]